MSDARNDASAPAWKGLDLDAFVGWEVPTLLVEKGLVYSLRDSTWMGKPSKENLHMAACSVPNDVPRDERDRFASFLASAPALLAYALEAREVLGTCGTYTDESGAYSVTVCTCCHEEAPDHAPDCRLAALLSLDTEEE